MRLNTAICFIFLLTLSDRSHPPSNQIPSATQSDSVRRPIRFRSPPDQIASAARLDCVRHTMTYSKLLRCQ